jgi:hypothetical protein
MERQTCPSCGGAGGGPIGRAGSAWDDEDYVCPRCEGEGVILVVANDVISQKPGLVKAANEAAVALAEEKAKRTA